MPGIKKFWNAILTCNLLRKNFQNSVPEHPVTKTPLDTTFELASEHKAAYHR
jgi:hypothetical protein